MAYAHRHKEMDALTTANALRLSDLRLTAKRDWGKTAAGGSGPHVPGASDAAQAVGGASVVAADSPYVVTSKQPTGDGSGTPDGPVDRGHNMVLPLGGLKAPRPGAERGTSGGRAPAPIAGGGGSRELHDADLLDPAAVDGSNLEHDDGGIVVSRRIVSVRPLVAGLSLTCPRNRPLVDGAATEDEPAISVKSAVAVETLSPAAMAAAASAAASAIDSKRLVRGEPRAVFWIDEAPAGVVYEQPVIEPASDAVKCVTAILDGAVARTEVRDVLDKLVADSLLCLVRLHGGMVASFSASVMPAVELAWVGVRNVHHRWLPIWEAGATADVSLAPPGTASFLSHPGRRFRVLRWALKWTCALSTRPS